MVPVQFDPKQPYRAVAYLRVSDPHQNPRSPQQQLDEINRLLELMGLPWIIVAIYRDGAKSGRYYRRRKGFQRMIADLKARLVVADLVLTDTYQRFGRAEELPAIRRELRNKHGVLLLTADSRFANPESPEGRARGVMDEYQAVEENRVKSHNIGRGKRDCVRLKHWPGGAPPFGYTLHTMFKTEHGRQVVDFSILKPHPEERHIVPILFREALATGYGQTKLTKHLNSLDEIPAKFRTFKASTIARWMRDEIYIGSFEFNEVATDIIDDTRIVKKNPADQIVRVEGFCEPIVDPAVFWPVKRMFDARSARHKERNQASADGKLIAPLVRGLTLFYLLSGLLFCSHCKQRMVLSSNRAYVAKDGESRRYASYVCSAYQVGACPNGMRVPERWLCRVVIAKLRERLFGE